MSDDNKDLVETTARLKLDANAPKPRLCHLKKWPNFQGYGFNLHAERSKMGQHIGKVDANSPAESAGLLEGDRIIEVNYVNISNENHQQVVKRIRNGLPIDPESPEDGKLNADEVVLLVLDHETDEYYKNLNIIVKHDFENVLKLITSPPPSQPKSSSSLNENDTTTTNNNNDIENKNDSNVKVTTSDNTSVNSTKSNTNLNNNNTNTINVNDKLNRSSSSNSKTSTRSISSNDLDSNNNNVSSNNSSTRKLDNNIIFNSNHNNNNTKETTNSNSQLKSSFNETSKTPTMNNTNRITDSNGTLSSNKSGSNVTNGTTMKTDPYQMSAAEFRNYLKTKGRNDPRIVPVDMKQKYELFQNM